MRVRLITECKSPNPAFDPAKALAAAKGGPAYSEPPDIVRQPGEEIEHPDAWRLCVSGHLNVPPVAVPVDDQARAAYGAALKRRKQAIADLDLLLKNKKPANDQERAWLDSLRDAYFPELQALDPKHYGKGKTDAQVGAKAG